MNNQPWQPRRLLRAIVGAAAFAAFVPSSQAQTDGTLVTLNTVVPNATGVQFGFWENQTYQYQTFHTFGHRPTARVAIDAWNSIEGDNETTAGNYNWKSFDTSTLADLKLTHQYGETIFAAVNVSFSAFTSGSKDTIPAFYADQDITQPATRAAALKFLTAYVKHLLPAVGSFTLTVDYEVVSNFNLASTQGDDAACGTAAGTNLPWYACRDTRATTWAYWFADAAKAIHDAAAAYNKANATNYVVQVQPIVNGNVTDPTNAVNTGSKAWIPVMVAASDAIAMDNYHCAYGQPVTSAQGEIDAIKQWNSLLGTTKRIVVAENGFSSGLSTEGNICQQNNLTQGKFKGTPTEQATYYTNLLPALRAATISGGPLYGRLASFNIWSTIDNPLVAPPDTDHFFGVVGQPPAQGQFGADKPATRPVHDLITGFETDPTLMPTTEVSAVDITQSIASGATISFNAGADHSFVRYTHKPFGIGQACTLSVTIKSALADDRLMLHVDGNDWLSAPIAASTTPTTISTPLNAAQCSGEGTHALTVDIYVTGDSFPVKRTITAVTSVRSS